MVEAGQATFRIGDRTLVVERGTSSSVRPARRTASRTPARRARLVAIHGAARFDTEWLEGPDPTWSSRRRPAELAADTAS